MAKTVMLATGAIAILLTCNEAAAISSATDHQFSRVSARSSVALETQAMSVDHAIHILRSMNTTSPELISFVQADLGSHPGRKSKKVSGGLLQTQTPGPLQEGSADANADYSPGLKNAMVRLNEMMLETIMTWDEVELECAAFDRHSRSYIGELRRDRDYYAPLLTEGLASISNARQQKSAYGDEIPKLANELKLHNQQCSREMATLHGQLRVTKSDAEVMDKILNMTQCSDVAYEKADAAGLKVVMLQCVNKHTGKRYTKMRATDPELKKQLAKLKHHKSIKALSTAMVVDPAPVALVQQQGRRLRQTPNSDGFVPPGMPEIPAPEYGQVILNATADPNLEQGAEECSISNSSKCPELRERFVNIAGGVEDAIEELETMIENKQLRCQEIRTDLEAALDHNGYWYKMWETRLDEAVATLGELRRQFNDKNLELGNEEGTRTEKITACLKSRADSKSELCALGKIRGELATMSAWDKEITDCTVSGEDEDCRVFGEEITECRAWNMEDGGCSQTCGGGVATLTRTVNGMRGAGTEDWDQGHKCPLLKATESCNEGRCPVDCELEEWEEWSRCTVTCGGGVQERMRAIVQHPTPGTGNPCELALETVICNGGPCDIDCVLSEWTEWSTTCTKMCGSGQSTRVKTLVMPEKGAGECATFYEPTRFHARPCNTQPCEYHRTVGHCVAQIDVVLVIDGSGSLGSDGWRDIKGASLALARSLGGGANLAAMVYSGPPDSCKLRKCTGRELPWWCFHPYTEFDYNSWVATPASCGIDWISHLSSDVPTVIEKMEKMEWPAQCTLTSKAIKATEIELINSRRGTPSVVIVLTDGYPYSNMHTEDNSVALKDSGARLMMVPIGAGVSDDTSGFAKMVSYPERDNLVVASTFEDLTQSNDTINEILTRFCTNFVP